MGAGVDRRLNSTKNVTSIEGLRYPILMRDDSSNMDLVSTSDNNHYLQASNI